MNWALFQNSLLVSGTATLLAVSFGFLAALWLAAMEARWRNRLLLAAIVTLVLPSFLVTNCWLNLLGHTGVWRAWLPLNIYSLGGTIWILALLTWPITLLAVLGAWQRLEPSQLESDAALSGGWLIAWLLLPQAGTALAQAAVLTFVLTLNNFAVPAILQTKVFPAELWVSFNTTFDYVAAWKLSLPLMFAPLVLLVVFSRQEINWPRLEGGVAASVFRRQLGASWYRASGVVTALVVIVAAGLPLLQLFATARTWLELSPTLAAGRAAIVNSVSFATLAATLCLATGLMTWRWPLGLISWLPFLTPGVLLGIVLIAVFNRPVLAAFYQSLGIVILAFTVRYLAIGWNGAALARRAVDRDLTDAAKLSGASGWQMFRHVHWPQLAPQLAAVWYVIYLLCLWDVETLVLIVPPGGETLALRIFNLLHYGHNAQVNALCLCLLGLAVLPLVVWRAWQVAWCRVRGAGAARAGAVVLASLATMLGTGCGNPGAPGQARLQIQIFERVQVIGSRGTGSGQFNKPRSVAVDAQDNLFVVDMTGRVQKFSPDGQFLLAWQMPQTDKGRPKGLCPDRRGNMVVNEPHYSRINYFKPDGKLVAQWGVNGTNAGQLAFPRAVAVNSRNEIWVSEYGLNERVQRFTAEGKFVSGLGQPGAGDGQFNRPEGLGVDAADRVYVADSCNHRVQVFSPEGKFLRAFGKAGSAPGQMSYPYDVRVDEAGRQYVCEFGNSRIQIFDAQDRPIEIVGGPGSRPGQFSNPWGIALDSHGNLYVADSQNHRVQKFIRKGIAMTDVKPPVESGFRGKEISRVLTNAATNRKG